MTSEPAARRYAASAFPEIDGVRLNPSGAPATLVNLSATGALIECASRELPGRALTLEFLGAFVPASIGGRVVRCDVSGIAADGSLRYHLGVAFHARIALANDVEADGVPSGAVRPADSGAGLAASAACAPALRNRW